MNNTVLKILAGLLALGAVAVAIIGIQLSQRPAAPVPAAAPASIPTEAVIVAARAIKAGQAISAADLQVKGLAAPAPQVFRSPQNVMGRVAMIDLPAGTPLEPKQFATGTMASNLLAGERAVAVFVDEVVGLGGFGKPGDHVDVLGFVGSRTETNDNSFAQVVVHDARILSFGDATQMEQTMPQPEAAQDSVEAATSKTAEELAAIKERRLSLRSAVLAVPESEATRLMLAASAGTLRLSLRPPAANQPDALGIYPAGSQATAAKQERQTIALSDIAPGAKKHAASDADSGVIIQEGSKERRLAKNEFPSQP